MIPECGCERGYDCTKTTVCALQNALEDQAGEYEVRIEALETELKELKENEND